MAHTQTKAQAELAEKVTKDYLWAKKFREQYEPEWLRFYDLYMSIVGGEADTSNYPYTSNIFVPYTYAIIETQLPIAIQQFFSSGDFVGVVGKRIDSEQYAEDVKNILEHQFTGGGINGMKLAYMMYKQAAIYGTAPVFTDWDYLVRKSKVRVPVEDASGVVIDERTEKVFKVIRQNPISEVIDIFKYFQCPTTPGDPWEDDNVLFAGWQFALTYEELLELMHSEKLNKNVLLLKDEAGVYSTAKGLELRLSKLGKDERLETSAADNDKYGRRYFTCIRYFGKIATKDGLELRNIVICYPGGYPGGGDGGFGEGIVLWGDEEEYTFDHQRIPITLTRINLMEGELYGLGDIKFVESLQTELTDQRNQKNDIVGDLMSPMYTVLEDSSIDESQLERRPNGLIRVRDHDEIRPIRENPQQLTAAYMNEEILKKDMQFTSGISDFIVGQFQNSSGFNDTATGISIIQAAGMQRIVLKINFVQAAIKNIFEMVWALDQQYLPFNTVFRILDPLSASKYRFLAATPSLIGGNYQFILANAAAIGNPQIIAGQLIQFMQAIPNLQQTAAAMQQPFVVDINNLVVRFLKALNIPNISEIMPQLAAKQNIGIPDGFDEQAGGPDPLDPEVENEQIMNGETGIQVNPRDDDLQHILVHDLVMGDANPEQQSEIKQHNTRHLQQIKQKEAQMTERVANFAGQLEQQKLDAFQNEQEGQSSEENASPETGNSSPNDAGGAETIIRQIANAGAGNV